MRSQVRVPWPELAGQSQMAVVPSGDRAAGWGAAHRPAFQVLPKAPHSPGARLPGGSLYGGADRPSSSAILSLSVCQGPGQPFLWEATDPPGLSPAGLCAFRPALPPGRVGK